MLLFGPSVGKPRRKLGQRHPTTACSTSAAVDGPPGTGGVSRHQTSRTLWAERPARRCPGLGWALSAVCLSVTPWAVALQAPLPMRFPSKETGVGCHSLFQGASRPTEDGGHPPKARGAGPLRQGTGCLTMWLESLSL